MSSTDPHSQLVMGLKKLAGDITAASASDANGMDGTFVASSITVLLEKFDQEEKSVVDSNVSVAEQLASLLATVSAPGAAQVSAPDAACLKRDRGVIKQNLGAVPFLKRDVDGSLDLQSFTESFQFYAQSVDNRLGAVLEGFPTLTPDNADGVLASVPGDLPSGCLMEVTSAFLSKLDTEFRQGLEKSGDAAGFFRHWVRLLSVYGPAEEDGASAGLAELMQAEMGTGEDPVVFATRIARKAERVNKQHGRSVVGDEILLHVLRAGVVKEDPARYSQVVTSLEARYSGGRVPNVLAYASALKSSTKHIPAKKKVHAVEPVVKKTDTRRRKEDRRGQGGGYCFRYAQYGHCDRENCRFPHTHRMVPESELAPQQPRPQLQHPQPQQHPQPSVPVGALDALPGQGPFRVHQELHHPGLGVNVVTVKINHSLAKKAPPPGAILDTGAAQSCSAEVDNARPLAAHVVVEVADGTQTRVTQVGDVTIGGTVFENVLRVPGMRTLIAVSPYDQLGCTFTVRGGMMVGRTPTGRVFVSARQIGGLYQIVQ